jgi:hypothetical protein
MATVYVVVILGCGPGTEDTKNGTSTGSSSASTGGTSTGSGTTVAMTGTPSSGAVRFDVGDSGTFVPDGGSHFCDNDWPVDGCAAHPVAMSNVQGTTPLGVLPDGPSFAVFGAVGFCQQCVTGDELASIVIVSSPDELDPLMPWLPPDNGLVLDLQGFSGPLSDPISATLEVYVDAEMASTTNAEFEIDNLPTSDPNGDPANVVGRLSAMDSNGWNLQGDFVAQFCPNLNTFAVCE